MEAATGSSGEQRVGSSRAVRHVEAVFWAWLVAVGVDLFFNAGLFSPLFDQGREPGLLPDEELFVRIPVAYVIVAVEVTVLAWLMGRAPVVGAAPGATLGAAAGAFLALGGVVWLWTAIEVTAAFVAAAVVTQMSMLAAAGAVLGAVASGASSGRLRFTCSIAFFVSTAAAILAQNLLS